MSDNVVKLPVKPKPQAREQNNQFFCLRCDVDSFRLFSNGSVHCAGCGCVIKNILVKERT